MSEYDFQHDSKQKYCGGIGGGYGGGGSFGGGELSDAQRIFAAAMRSRDIVRDLTAVCMDRPYQYARIMQSLAKCMPTTKIRILNGRVLERAKRLEQENKAKQARAEQKALRSPKDGSAPVEPNETANAADNLSAGGLDADNGAERKTTTDNTDAESPKASAGDAKELPKTGDASQKEPSQRLRYVYQLSENARLEVAHPLLAEVLFGFIRGIAEALADWGSASDRASHNKGNETDQLSRQKMRIDRYIERLIEIARVYDSLRKRSKENKNRAVSEDYENTMNELNGKSCETSELLSVESVSEIQIHNNEQIPYDLVKEIVLSGDVGLLVLWLVIAQWGVSGVPSDLIDPMGLDWKGPPIGKGKRPFDYERGGFGIAHFDGERLKELYEKFGYPEITDTDFGKLTGANKTRDARRLFLKNGKAVLFDAIGKDAALKVIWDNWAKHLLVTDSAKQAEVVKWCVWRWIEQYWTPSLKGNDTIEKQIMNARIRNSSPALAVKVSGKSIAVQKAPYGQLGCNENVKRLRAREHIDCSKPENEDQVRECKAECEKGRNHHFSRLRHADRLLKLVEYIQKTSGEKQ